MLMRTDPLRDLTTLSRLLDGSGQGAPMDAYRQGDVITVQFDLPGVDPEGIDVQIERGELRLTAQRRGTAPDDARFLLRERAPSTIHRRVMLGDVLDVTNVDAEYVDGVLTLRIPLHDTAKPRRIAVRHERGASERQAIDVGAP